MRVTDHSTLIGSHSPGVISSSITAISAVIVATVTSVFAYLASRSRQVKEAQKETREMHREMVFQTLSLGFAEFTSGLRSIEQEIDQLRDSTEIDRVLMLKGWNGLREMRYVTAFYQSRSEGQGAVSYINFPTDVDYRERVNHTRDNRRLYFEVDDTPNSEIMTAYRAEGLKASYWVHCCTVQLAGSESGSKCIVFMSFGTHGEGGISEQTRASCDRIAEQVAAIVREFYDLHPETEVVG